MLSFYVFPIRFKRLLVFVVSVVIVRSAEQGIRKILLVEPMIRVIVRIAVKLAFFSDICLGEVIRYEADAVSSLNFVLKNALGGGVTRSLAVDKHGKTLGMALLEMDI